MADNSGSSEDSEFQSKNDWRKLRGPGWTGDIGYAIQEVIQTHRYESRLNGSKANDPGWHPCTCGWEGYWSSFESHVADELRALVIASHTS